MGTDRGGRSGMNRREFVRRAAAGTLGAGLLAGGVAGDGSGQEAAPKLPRRVLGRTGLEVSAISFGSWGFSNSDLLNTAIDAGMSLVDTSPRYQEGAAETAIGQTMAERRDEVALMTKWYVRPDTTREQLLMSLDRSLQRLQTEKVDIVHVGEAETVEQLQNPAVFTAFEEAKAAGKVDFLGVSSHAGKRDEICEHAISDGRFDMLCIKHNYGEHELTDGVLDLAREKEVGVVVFKVKMGAKAEDVAEFAPGKSFGLCAAKWALETEAVQSVTVAISSYADISLYARAPTLRLDTEERMALEAFRGKFLASYCRYCGACTKACPNRVVVADVMRYRMYAESYGRAVEARRLYERLPADLTAAICAACRGNCVGACPNGLNTQERLIEAHRMLA